jgi:uncharacterized protein with HEPN domain
MTSKDKIVLQKILSYIDEIGIYVQGYEFNSFLADRKTISACCFLVSQIGELAKEISKEIQDNNPDIPWRSVRGMRNKIVHDYENIDLIVLWRTIESSLPDLGKQLTALF